MGATAPGEGLTAELHYQPWRRTRTSDKPLETSAAIALRPPELSRAIAIRLPFAREDIFPAPPLRLKRKVS